MAAMAGDERALTLVVCCSVWLCAFTFVDPFLAAYFREADPALSAIWRRATDVGDSAWMIAASAAIALAAHRAAWRERLDAATPSPARPVRAALALRRRALFALVCVAGFGTIAALLKLAIGRARPKLADSLGAYHFEFLAFDYKLNSLPSGHAATLFALAAALALIAPRWRAIFYGVAFWGALSRTAAGAHYLSDVIAGAALGHYGARALACAAADRGFPVAMAAAPSEGRAALRAARVLARGGWRRLLSWLKEVPNALHRAILRRRRSDA